VSRACCSHARPVPAVQDSGTAVLNLPSAIARWQRGGAGSREHPRATSSAVAEADAGAISVV
jgi:hypothetical protein